jgi:hypothetical protein
VRRLAAHAVAQLHHAPVAFGQAVERLGDGLGPLGGRHLAEGRRSLVGDLHDVTERRVPVVADWAVEARHDARTLAH